MWSITTKAYVHHSVWTNVVTNDMVMRTINSFVGDATEAEEAVEEPVVNPVRNEEA